MTDYSLYAFRSKKIVKGYKWYDETRREMSNWLTATFGWKEWEFIDDRFAFKRESDLMLFLLRWT